MKKEKLIKRWENKSLKGDALVLNSRILSQFIIYSFIVNLMHENSLGYSS
jgi:hypothetical protein